MSGYRPGHRKQESSFGGGSFGSVPALSPVDTLLVHAQFIRTGCLDALKFQGVGEKLVSDRIVQSNVVKATLLQVVILVSALAIKPIIRASEGDHSTHAVTRSIFYALFHLFWLYPLTGAAIYYSGLLQPRNETDRRTGRARNTADYHGMTAKVVSDSYRALVTINYFGVIFLLRYIPYIGPVLSFLYACIVDSYYAFEQHWLKNGWSFSERVKFLEQRWAYFIGWGFPVTLVSWWFSDPLVNLALFSLFFPFFQILATSSMPQPLDPNLPTSQLTISFLNQKSGQTSFSMAAAEGGEEARGRKPSALIPVRIPVLFFADTVYSVLSASFAGKKKDAAGVSGGRDAGSNSSYHGSPAYGASAGSYGNDPTSPGGGWRGDYGASAGQSPVGSLNSRQYGHGGMAATPPRRGHQMTESSVGVGAGGPAVVSSPFESPYGASPGYGPAGAAYSPAGSAGGYADARLDNLIRSAAGRSAKKRE